MDENRNEPARLTARQRAFAEHYAAEKNATKAAIAAGYSQKSARFQASRLLANVDVQAYLTQLAKASRVSAERVLEALAQIGFTSDNEAVRVKALTVLARHFLPSAGVAIPEAAVGDRRVSVVFGGRYRIEPDAIPPLEINIVETREEMLHALGRHVDPDAGGDDGEDESRLTTAILEPVALPASVPDEEPPSEPVPVVAPTRERGVLTQWTGRCGGIRADGEVWTFTAADLEEPAPTLAPGQRVSFFRRHDDGQSRAERVRVEV